MKRNLLFLVIALSLACTSAVQAQSPVKSKEYPYEISCEVFDSFTHEGVIGCKAELLRPDSTYICDGTYYDKGRRGTITGGWRVQSIAYFYLATKEPADYIVRISKEGYETAYVPIHVRFVRGSKYYFAPDIYLRKVQKKTQDRQLGEAVVRATKIKMVMRGDTVVYNADAFQLAEGSMLDALIERLPGVKLDDNGVITVNGRRVESLLVNGRDFFRGDPSVALDNLPSYMVDKVKVYERTSAYDEFSGRESAIKPLVMDVNLKKEYSVGWVANAEAAYGTEERYLGRLFALGFTPKTHTALYGNLNNTNDSRRPGRTGEWTPAAIPNGQQAAKTAGGEFVYQDPATRSFWGSNFEFSHTDNTTIARTNRETFLPEGHTYGLSENAGDNCATNLYTTHSFQFQKDDIYTSGSAIFNFDRNRYTSTGRSGTWNTDPWAMSREGLLDSLFSADAPNLLRSLAVNRLRQDYLSRGKGWSVSFEDLAFSIRPFMDKGIGDEFRFSGTFGYDHRESETFDQYRLDYPAQPGSTPDLRNRYRNSPSRSYNYSVDGSYTGWFRNIALELKYSYAQQYSSGGKDLYRLDRLAGWEPGGENGLGLLPSTVEMETAQDFDNSAWREQWTKDHQVQVHLSHSLQTRSSILNWELYLPVTFREDHMDYRRGSVANPARHLLADRRRKRTLFQPRLSFSEIHTSKHGRRITFLLDASHTQAPADQLYLLGYTDDSDPLNISHGNPGLKDTRQTQAKFTFKAAKQGLRSVGGNVNYRLTTNAIAMGRTYDPATGAYTTRPENVNGNWQLWGDLNWTRAFGEQKRFTFDSRTDYNYHNNVDLTGVEGSAAPMRSTVRNLRLGETLRLEYSREKWRAGIKAHANWTHATSARQGFETVDAVDYHFAFTGRIELPGGVGFDTDLTLYSRRGYEDRTLNTDDLVWNARLSKSILGGSLTFIVDGFDILGQLSGVTRSLNAQGRTETFRNVLPSYFMAHVVYRLNIKPKNDRK